ncbi:salicylate synthase [Amycolatopsis sp. RM579]|uniref:Salicylate synthase n=2 Tax=Amycolatopsis pithecellobii TaxID=664692 RepID=A0A6N7Z6N6_9PSEU|nr:salicylate synthase [Amycolatopsis pithecellobii]
MHRPEPRSELGPARAAVALVTSGLFDEYVVYEKDGTWSVAGGSRATISVNADRIQVRCRHEVREWPGSSRPLGRLGEVLRELPIPEWTVYGWVAFEMSHALTGRQQHAGQGELAHLIVPEAEIRIGTAGATISCADELLRARIADVLANPPDDPVPATATEDVDLTSEWYPRAVANATREIRDGAFHKVILSRRVPVPVPIDLPQTYLRGRQANTPARSFLLDLGGRKAAGFCPETILEVSSGGAVSTQPLAGTRSFGNGEHEDNRLRAELLSDSKEIYEHALALQLAYNELSNICVPGSVAVTELMSVVQRGSLQHLASLVRGELAGRTSSWDALEACFPAVAASGIPKREACDYIARNEKDPRGLYSGAVLTASHDGALDAGLVLRSIYQENGTQWLQAGAGIVNASQPEREYEETFEKFRSVTPHLVPRLNPKPPNEQERTR